MEVTVTATTEQNVFNVTVAQGGTGPETGVQSVNGIQGPNVVLEATDINTQYIIAGETKEGTIQEGMTAYGHQIDGIWNNLNSLPPVASTGSYDDLTDKPAVATTSAAGFMSASDKTKLDGIEAGANLGVVSEQEESVGTVITNMIMLTQVEYDNLSSPNASTCYIII